MYTGVFESLSARPRSSASTVSDAPGEAGEDDVEVQRAHVWLRSSSDFLSRYLTLTLPW